MCDAEGDSFERALREDEADEEPSAAEGLVAPPALDVDVRRVHVTCDAEITTAWLGGEDGHALKYGPQSGRYRGAS